MYFIILWSKISLNMTEFHGNEVPQFPFFPGMAVKSYWESLWIEGKPEMASRVFDNLMVLKN